MGDPIRVLVVEDDAYMRLLLSAALPNTELVEAWRLSDALSIALDQTPDAVIVDRLLPDGDGLELIRQFRADPDLMHVPIVFLTATHNEGQRVTVLTEGADEYLSKTNEQADLTSLHRRLLRLLALDPDARLARRAHMAARAATGEIGDFDPPPEPETEQTGPKRRWFHRQ